MSESTDELLGAANQAHVAGRLAEAEEKVRRVLAADPYNASAHLLMVLAGKTHRNDLAFQHLNRVLDANADSFEALFWLSLLYRRKKEYVDASRLAERALQIRPRDAFAHNNLGLCYLDQFRLEDASEEFRAALIIQPNSPQTLHNLGTAQYLLGRDADAAESFERAIALSPGSIDSRLSLGHVRLSQTNPREAEQCARGVLRLNPKLAAAHLLLASALAEQNLTGQAEFHLKQATANDPQDARAHGLLGQRFQSLGRFSEANASLAKSLELEPRQGFGYFAYVYNNKLTENDRPLLEIMEGLAKGPCMDPRQTLFLFYALARAHESLGGYERSMFYLDEANRIARKLKLGDAAFDRGRYARHFDGLVQTFSQEFLDRNRTSGFQSDLPIVIVGMMRSGTTLMEQILSSHPEINAAGEQRFWPDSRPALFGTDGKGLDPERLAQLGARYVDVLREVAPGRSYVTDKLPANYELLGAIHLALPNAKIIHMRRNPLDTCLSIYATPNGTPVEYAYDRSNIVFAYEQYLRLMAHWRVVLPSSRFLEVNYEDVVSDRETEIRRVLEHVGLEWDEAVMHHEQNERNVLTPSLWQVRQPIYTSSVERWRHFEPWLGEFAGLKQLKI